VSFGFRDPAIGAVTIIPTYDSTITAAPNAQAIENCIASAAATYQQLFSDKLTVSILYRVASTDTTGVTVGLGRSLKPAYTIPYAEFLSALQASRQTAHDAVAQNNIPPSSPSLIRFSSALGRVLGFNTPGNLDPNGGSTGTFDGVITIASTAPIQYTRSAGVASFQYDALSIIEHETDEVLGLGSVLDTSATGQIKALDLFRYSLDSGTAALSLSGSAAATSYFSIDGGVTYLVGFNQDPDGDRGDWLSGQCSTSVKTGLVQYAFTCPGVTADVTALSPEAIALDVIGYTLATPPASPDIGPNGIVPLYSTVSSIQPGAWASIYGSNLATVSGGVWTGTFPTTLGETSVTVNGKPGYLYFVSPGQINFQAPDDTAFGPATVVVKTSGGSVSAQVNLAPVSPSFSLLDGKHPAAIIPRSDGSGFYISGTSTFDIAGPAGFSLGYFTTPAKAGDTLVFFGVGFGPTSPTVEAGQAYSGAAFAQNPVVVQIGNTIAMPAFAGLSAAGQYQINLTLPAGLGAGDVPLVATVAGVSTQTGVVLSVR
jgi:uncharacterized protein (TIGR03437 family)